MNTYVSSFASGFQSVINDALQQLLEDCTVLDLMDGLVIYRTDDSLEKIISLRFFNNTFLLLEKFSDLNSREPIKQMMELVLKNNRLEKSLNKTFDNLKRGMSFRLIFSNQNELVSVNKVLREKIEKIIERRTKLIVNRVLPEIEFWFLYRSQNVGFFMLRLTKQSSSEKSLHKGELRPEISNLLCYMSEPKEMEVFLDPFSGYGSIPLERISSFPSPNLIYARDVDEEKNLYTKEKLKKIKAKKNKIIIQQADFLGNEKKFEDGFIDKIVTDPPWGIYEGIEDVEKFYSRMLDELIRILKSDGIIILLTAKKLEFENCIVKQTGIKKWDKIDVLVSGKKAAVYKIIKN